MVFHNFISAANNYREFPPYLALLESPISWRSVSRSASSEMGSNVLYVTGLGRHTNIPDQICQRVAFAADWNNAGRNSDVIKLKLT